MTIEMLRLVLPVVVALVVPLFFLVIYVSSSFSRLRLLRKDCRAQLATVFELFGDRRSLAMKAVERLRQQGTASPELAGLETAVAATSILPADPSNSRVLEDRIPSLGGAGAELERALASLLRPEPASRPPEASLTDLLSELDSNQAATWSALLAYNQAVARYAEARNRFPVRLFAGICGFGSLQRLPVCSEVAASRSA